MKVLKQAIFHTFWLFLSKLMRIRILLVTFIYADLDPTFHFDADPDPTFQIKAQNLEKVLNGRL